MKNQFEAVPLKNLDEWEDDLLRRYPDPENIATSKSTEEYRNYDELQRDTAEIRDHDIACLKQRVDLKISDVPKARVTVKLAQPLFPG